ncbi:hypothetical protein WHR41_01314 [Cladosporium halotolerans]|uniref:Phospholipase D/nuclease n=1 Tax=Cladosporium halotolerans TaxID=1052096 RepID=A0AB34KYS2_9PEZI
MGNNKRERSISPPARREARKAPKLDASTVELPSGAKLTSFATTIQNDQKTRKTPIARAANESMRAVPTAGPANGHLTTPPASQTTQAKPGSVQYPRGVVKKTWAFGHERNGKDIKLEEVLEPQTLKTAVLSAFQWDTEWLFRKLKMDQTKLIFVMQAKEQSLKDEMLKQTEHMRKSLRLCFPSMAGNINCMHSKLMLLFHPEKLRVAIPTANLLDFDWGESGMMENSVWLIDLPRLPNNRKTSMTDMTDFGKELLHFVEKQGLPQDARDGVLNFDFSATKDIAFVHTVGGMNYGPDAERTGLPGLSHAVRQHDLATINLQVDFAASSMGSLNDDYLRDVHAAASGTDVIKRAAAAAANAKASFFQQGKQPASAIHNIRDKIRLYFPTHETVTSSKAGAAGTICLSRKWFEGMQFPRRCFRDYVSTRVGLLSHNKILYARGVQKGDVKEGDETTPDRRVAWAYVGSANMSESAWGKLVYDRKEKQWKVNCRNWECGVLLPVSTEGVAAEEGESGGVVGMEVFKDVVEPPFMYPGIEYEDREPWYFQERH